jgi:hypothetical protein
VIRRVRFEPAQIIVRSPIFDTAILSVLVADLVGAARRLAGGQPDSQPRRHIVKACAARTITVASAPREKKSV